MKPRTLAEAAAEVLASSKAKATHATMQKGLDVYKDHPAAEVHDLGGATYEHPEGDDVGKKAADAAHTATAPGAQPAADTKEKMHKVKDPSDHEGSEKVKPPFATQSGHPEATAGHEVAPHHEEVESDEEVITEEEVEMTEEEIAEAKKAKHHMMKEKMKHMGVKEDIEALFNGEELSEEFKLKAETIFEAAVIARALPLIEEMETEILAAAEDTVNEIKQGLEEQVDAYLGYMAEEWVKENEVAIETGLKNEITEEFMSGLKNLFAEHYINVPDEKIDVLAGITEEVEELKSKLNEALNKNIELSQAIVEAKKTEIISSVCEGLTATQAEKVKTLAEGVEFTTEGDYSKKLGIIRENYSKAESVKQTQNAIALTESEEPVQVAEVSPVMDRYVKALSRTLAR